MNSPKVKTQKTLSALIALALAVITLFSASTAQSSEPKDKEVKLIEADIIAEIDQMLLEDEEEITLLDQIDMEEEAEYEVKVFDVNNELIGEGSTEGNGSLRLLVNKAEFVSKFAGTQYYRIVR